MPKWESMIFIAIVFTILKDMDNEIVMQNHYVCCNYFDKYFRRCSFLFPTDYLYFKKILRTQVHKNFSQVDFLQVLEIWNCCSKTLANQIESTCGPFGPQNISIQPNESEYMCESFRPGTVSSSYSLTNKTESYL